MAIRTSSMGIKNETSFFLIYKIEEVIVIEIITPTQHAIIKESNNNSERSLDLVLSEELCTNRESARKTKNEKWHLTLTKLSGPKPSRLENRFYSGCSRIKRNGWLGN